MNKDKKNSNWVLIFVVIFVVIGGTIGKDLGRYVSDKFIISSSKMSTEEVLRRVSTELNKKVPFMIDKDTRLDSTGVIGDEIIYKYTIVNLNLANYDHQSLSSVLNKEFRPKLLNGVCGDSMKNLRDIGASFAYLYYDNQGKEILNFKIESSECDI